MFTFLFWNLKGNDRLQVLVRLVKLHELLHQNVLNTQYSPVPREAPQIMLNAQHGKCPGTWTGKVCDSWQGRLEQADCHPLQAFALGASQHGPQCP